MLVKKQHTVLYFIFNFIIILFILNSCKKDPKPETIIETGTVSDIEGNIYKTVKIGNQWWMAENLKVTKYRNGNSIPKIANYDTTQWNNLKTGAYCIYDDNAEAPGLLYNFYAISDTNNIAPAGWHVPTDGEWKELEQTLGMSKTDADKLSWRGSNEGEKLKIEAPKGWAAYSKVWGTNESGFTALAGGCRMFNGIWSTPSGIGFTGFWWTSSEQPGNQAWYRYLDYKNTNVFRFYGPNTYGFSIRCIKD
jgi:uncharacterized protein (TIGR02145 family)